MLEHPVFIHMPTELNKPYFNNRSSAETVITVLMTAQQRGWLRLHGFVVLPTALEMVASPLKQGAAGVVAHIQAETIPLLTVIQPDAGFFWERHYTATPLMTQRALDARLKMMLLAPVAVEISNTAESYPYSSANPRYSTHVAEFAGFPKDDETLSTKDTSEVAALADAAKAADDAPAL